MNHSHISLINIICFVGKTIKKKNKMMTTIKLLIIGAILKSKIDIALKLFSAAVQTKIFFLLLTMLMIQKLKLLVDLKKSSEPKKEIYYEQSQHDHHYDGDIWGREDEGGLWGR